MKTTAVTDIGRHVDKLLFEKLRGRMKKELGFDVDYWDRGDLQSERKTVTIFKEGRPYDLVRKGIDLELKDLSNRTLAEMKATDSGKIDEFIKKTEQEMKKEASMIRPITERIRFAASLILRTGTLDPEMMKAMAPELVEQLVKKNIIPRDKEDEAEKEMLMILKPGKGWVPSREAVLAPEMLDAMKEMAPKLVDHLVKKQIIPPEKEREAEREISRAKIPAEHIPKMGVPS